MIKTINFQEFVNEFKTMNRDNNFSYEGKKALFDYLEEYEESTGEKVELDIIALCCEYTEYESLRSLQESYSNIKDMQDLENHTQVILIEGTDRIIIQDF